MGEARVGESDTRLPLPPVAVEKPIVRPGEARTVRCSAISPAAISAASCRGVTRVWPRMLYQPSTALAKQ
jgi:hypothetical protein